MEVAMKARVAGLVLCSAIGLLLGAVDVGKDAQHPQEPITVREITPEEARQALIEVIELSSDRALTSSLAQVKNAKITPSAVGGKWLDIGPWACFLAERKVSMMVGAPAAYVSFRGDLELSSDGKWRVTNLHGGYVCALHPPPPPTAPAAR
jgi:hypothetical protein